MSEKPFHVLIVEDEIKIAEILTDYLSQSGFTVSCHATGNGAVAIGNEATRHRNRPARIEAVQQECVGLLVRHQVFRARWA